MNLITFGRNPHQHLQNSSPGLLGPNRRGLGDCLSSWHTGPQADNTADFPPRPDPLGLLVNLLTGVVASQPTVDIFGAANLDRIEKGWGCRRSPDSLPDLAFYATASGCICAEECRLVPLYLITRRSTNESTRLSRQINLQYTKARLTQGHNEPRNPTKALPPPSLARIC